jgi:oligopeptide/dipeptide ABC transporter ATP-binding protein
MGGSVPESSTRSSNIECASKPVLTINDLRVDARREGGGTPLLSGVSLRIYAGETLGLVGESGSGKTLTALAVMGVLSRGCSVTGGSVLLGDTEIAGPSRCPPPRVQGADIGIIFQDPVRSLHPAFTVGDQIAEVARRHLGLNRRDAFDKAVDALESVGIPRPRERAKAYPHTFSGGMAQRAMIAMALVCEPRLLLADEPTTALDVTVQRQVLELLQDLQDRLDLAILFITHDLGVVAEICDRVAIMYAGEIVETAQVVDTFHDPKHPYTRALLDSLPQGQDPGSEFTYIAGRVPAISASRSRCRATSWVGSPRLTRPWRECR